jgi:D-beta-D-heptose 7-phosphate kinase/D-beta-D-heptose 1-phosphate adenosyltransferase
MDAATLQGWIEAIGRVRVLCVGDVVLDQYVYGATRRVSPEAPVPVLDEHRREPMLGAVGNVARNVKALGAHPVLVSLIGNDPEGQTLSRLLDAEGVTDVDLVAAHERATPMKTRFLCNGQQMFCVDRDPNLPLSPDLERDLVEIIRSAASDCDIAILADYGRGMITPRLAQAMMQACAAEGVRVCVDPRGDDYTRYDGAYLIKPNADELADEARLPADTDAEVEEALDAVMATIPGVETLLVTRSAQGMSARTRDGAVRHHRVRPREVFDVSGAGDTSIAALTLSLGAGASLQDAMEIADMAAGVVVTKVGTATVRPQDLMADLGEGGALSAEEKVISRADACEMAARWRMRGFRVGFTNGIFDILHPGHVSLLRQARAHCDRLIVGLNDDASTSRLKGPGRPVNSAAARAQVIAALDCVDRVVVDTEDTPQALLEDLKPDVLTRGGGRTSGQLGPFSVETVKGYGGEVKQAWVEPDHSTKKLLTRMRETTD